MCECGALWGWRLGFKLWEDSKSLLRRNGVEVMVCLLAVMRDFTGAQKNPHSGMAIFEGLVCVRGAESKCKKMTMRMWCLGL